MQKGLSNHIETLKSLWKSEPFQLGIPVIDLQHIWLVHILVELEEKILEADETGEAVDVQPSFKNALDYVSEHFALEEEILEHFSYPDFDSHVKGHRQFVEKLTEKFYEAENSQVAALGLLQILKNWLFKHILHDDRDYGDFFNSANIDLKSFCNSLLRSGKYPISKEQLLFYQNIIQVDLNQSNSVNLQTQTIDTVQEIQNIWKTYNLETGIPIIDLQHIWLLKMIVDLDNAMKAGVPSKETFQKIMNSALDYTKNHFNVEDQIMRYFRYTDTVNHSNQHKRFIEFIKLRNDEFKMGNPRAGLHLVQDLRNWLLSHIAFEDKKIGLAFRNRVRELSEFTKKMHKKGEVTILVEQKKLYKLVVKSDRDLDD